MKQPSCLRWIRKPSGPTSTTTGANTAIHSQVDKKESIVVIHIGIPGNPATMVAHIIWCMNAD